MIVIGCHSKKVKRRQLFRTQETIKFGSAFVYEGIKVINCLKKKSYDFLVRLSKEAKAASAAHRADKPTLLKSRSGCTPLIPI